MFTRCCVWIKSHSAEARCDSHYDASFLTKSAWQHLGYESEFSRIKSFCFQTSENNKYSVPYI